jgi:hypothetical protein
LSSEEPQPDPGWPADEVRAWREHLAAEKSAQRDAFMMAAAQAAAQAIGANEDLRAANAITRTALTTYIDGTPPAGLTQAQLLAWLYDRTKDLARVCRSTTDQTDLLTRESDGLISLFRSVIPAVDELLDESGAP